MDDSQLLKHLQNPKTRELAFNELVNQYKERLYWQIRRMVMCHEDSDDILQNTFIKAWQGLDNFRGEARLGTWLFRIAYNETLNFLSQNKNKYNLEDISLLADQLESDPYFNGDETQRMLQEAIAELPTKQRQVFLLKYFDEMRYEDMSHMLNTSVGALKASYHHAVKKISDFFHARD